MDKFDHPIFLQSLTHIQDHLGETGLDPLQQQVLERLIHSSGDFGLTPLFRFSSNACQKGLSALKSGAPILTDTAMALAAVEPMAMRTLNPLVRSALDWAPVDFPQGTTRSAL